VHNVFEIQEQQENQPPLQEDTVGNHEQPLQQNEKKKKKINNSKINIHQEKSCHKIDQFPGLTGHIGLRKGIPLRMYFID
jgi:hypothetical protein